MSNNPRMTITPDEAAITLSGGDWRFTDSEDDDLEIEHSDPDEAAAALVEWALSQDDESGRSVGERLRHSFPNGIDIAVYRRLSPAAEDARRLASRLFDAYVEDFHADFGSPEEDSDHTNHGARLEEIRQVVDGWIARSESSVFTPAGIHIHYGIEDLVRLALSADDSEEGA